MCSQWLKCGLWILICMELTWPFSLAQSRAGGLHDDVWIGVSSSDASHHEGRKKFIFEASGRSLFQIKSRCPHFVYFDDMKSLRPLPRCRTTCQIASRLLYVFVSLLLRVVLAPEGKSLRNLRVSWYRRFASIKRRKEGAVRWDAGKSAACERNCWRVTRWNAKERYLRVWRTFNDISLEYLMQCKIYDGKIPRDDLIFFRSLKFSSFIFKMPCEKTSRIITYHRFDRNTSYVSLVLSSM